MPNQGVALQLAEVILAEGLDWLCRLKRLAIMPIVWCAIYVC